MARPNRGARLEGLVAHTDAGSHLTASVTANASTNRPRCLLSDRSATACDNALAESVNALYKTELIRGPQQGPWRTIDDVELATLGWVHWYNTARIHGYLGDRSPDEYETAYTATTTNHNKTENHNIQPAQNPG